jgi:hypothetical protein
MAAMMSWYGGAGGTSSVAAIGAPRSAAAERTRAGYWTSG